MAGPPTEEWQVRESAAMSLAFFGSSAREAVPRLLALLEDEEWLVRRASAAFGAQCICIHTGSE